MWREEVRWVFRIKRRLPADIIVSNFYVNFYFYSYCISTYKYV